MSVKAEKVRETLGNNILADGFDLIQDLEKSHGSWIVDARDGSEHLDMFSMYASGSIGYNHPKIVESQHILGRVSKSKPTLSDLYNSDYADFMKTFDEIAISDYLKHTFY